MQEKQESMYGVDALLLEELRIQSWFGHTVSKQTVSRDETMERIKKYVIFLNCL